MLGTEAETDQMADAEKLSITLPGELAEMIRERVRAGACPSGSEVVREALLRACTAANRLRRALLTGGAWRS